MFLFTMLFTGIFCFSAFILQNIQLMLKALDIVETAVNRSKTYICHLVKILQHIQGGFANFFRRNLLFEFTSQIKLYLVRKLHDAL